MKEVPGTLPRPAAAAGEDEGCHARADEAGMEPWMAWAERCGDGLVDMGTPLGGGRKVTAQQLGE